jgi:hypothetical protein
LTGRINPSNGYSIRCGADDDPAETTMADSDDERAIRAAAFLAQALDLDPNLTPAAIAGDLARLKQEPHAAIFAAELDSSVGPAAFLVYVYALDRADPDGRTGRELFDTDLAILETAAERDAPGPRLIAHAHGDAEAYVLATTPATFRALQGFPPEEVPDAVTADRGDPTATADVAAIRQASAEELLRLLKSANTEAARWLTALRTGGGPDSPTAEGDRAETIAFNDAETELALFLLDERSIQSLLRALNLLLTAARQETDAAIGGKRSE